MSTSQQPPLSIAARKRILAAMLSTEIAVCGWFGSPQRPGKAWRTSPHAACRSARCAGSPCASRPAGMLANGRSRCEHARISQRRRPMTTTAPDILISPLRRACCMLSGMLTVTLYFTTILVVSTVLPQIQGAMSATADEVSWIVTFNILATAIATPMTGWLVARFGRRAAMCGCVGGFGFTTLMCGLAGSLEELIFWRIAQGALGAPTIPLNQSIVMDIYPRERHRFVLGLNGMGVVVGPVIGPTLAGYLAESHSWRWAFYILVPVCIAAFLGVLLALPGDRPRQRAPLDWVGFLSLSVALGGLQYVLSRGQRLDWFESGEIAATAALAVLAFYVFLAHSLTAEQPFLDLRLLFNRNLTLGYILVMLFGMLNFTPMVLMPTLLRQHIEYPDALVGWVIGSRGIGGVLGFFAAMLIDRIDYRISIASGFLMLFASGVWLMQFNLDVTPLEIILNGILQGLSVGIVIVPLTVVTFSDLESRFRPEASAVFHLLRNIASSLFISFSVAEVIRSTSANYARMAEMVSDYNRTLLLPWVMGNWDPTSVGGLARLSREMTRQSAMIAYLNAFGWFTLVSALAVPLALLIARRRPADIALAVAPAAPSSAAR
jgi:DHA2 family multidrug resistance protein